MSGPAKTSTTVDLYRVKSKILISNLYSFLRELVVHRSALLGAVVVMIFVLAAIFAPQITPLDPTKQRLPLSLLPPFWEQDESDLARLEKQAKLEVLKELRDLIETDEDYLTRLKGLDMQEMLAELERLTGMGRLDRKDLLRLKDLGKKVMVHPLGCDRMGMDLLSRVIYGTRISLLVGILVVGISGFIGIALGSIAGYYRGWFDTLISRFCDLLLAFPYLIFAILIMVIMGGGFMNMIFALTFKAWVEFFRLVRGEFLSEKTKEYIDAAKVAGQSSYKIIVFEILPNIIHSVVVLGTLRMGYMIIMEASLSYLGLGIAPPTPAWGSMVYIGKQDIITGIWWTVTFPGLAILALVLSINLLGEGLHDILDPRLKVD